MQAIAKIAATALAATTLATTAVPAKAFDNLYRVGVQHNQLINAIRSTGIQFILNDSRCNTENAMGWYWAARNEMVICQENRQASTSEVRWTAEDLDTLRHEAQHLIQDCMVASYRDGRLGPVYRDPIGLAQSVLSGRTIRWIVNDGYRNESDHVKVLELEAFAVAAINDPLEQAGDIKKYCF